MTEANYISPCARCGSARTKSTTTKKLQSPYCRSCASIIRWERDKKPDLFCKRCGQSFPFRASGGIPRAYCSRSCRINQVSKECPACKSMFTVAASNALRYNFCSKLCSNTRGVTLVCTVCNRSYRASKTQKRTHCSLRCYRISEPETGIEKKMRLLLEANNISFIQEYAISKRDVFDFFLPEFTLLIECDGEYWHSSKRAKVRDQQKNQNAEAMGFQIMRFAENEIESNKFESQLFAAIQQLQQ